MCRFCSFIAGIVVCAIGVVLVGSSISLGIDDTLLSRINVALIGLAMTVWTFPEHTGSPSRISGAELLEASIRSHNQY